MSAATFGTNRWQLPQHIIALSEADTWAAARKEWFPNGVEISDVSQTCLCTHTPIIMLCHIKNKKNGSETTVGNVCIGKFSEEEGTDPKFKKIGSIFAAMKRIQADITNSANLALIEYAFDKKVFSMKDYGFYEEIWRKRSLSSKQIRYLKSLNNKLLNHIILTAKECFERLKRNQQKTAGKKLIDSAKKHKVITDWEYNFATKNIDRSWTKLTEKQRPHRLRINVKILRGFASKYDLPLSDDVKLLKKYPKMTAGERLIIEAKNLSQWELGFAKSNINRTWQRMSPKQRNMRSRINNKILQELAPRYNITLPRRASLPRNHTTPLRQVALHRRQRKGSACRQLNF